MDWHSETFKRLLRLAKEDEQARSKVLEATAPLVYREVRDVDEAQEAFLAVLLAVETYDEKQGPWGPYAANGIFMRLMSWRRKEARWKSIELRSSL